MSCLIVGLGNIGIEYANTRHNVGFTILDTFAEVSNFSFTSSRYGSIAEYRFKGKDFLFLKPSTYMNLSGKAVKYWLSKEKISIDQLLVVADDLALPFGTLRIRKKGSDGGHNGLKDIIYTLETDNFSRLRVGIGSNFPKGSQIDYVLNSWEKEELTQLPEISKKSIEIIKSFVTSGIDFTMNNFNSK